MEPIVLNTSFETVAVIDAYESLIWTDRYNTYGDFELYCPMNASLLEFLKQDNYFWLRDSEHTMIIEDISIDSDTEDGNHLVVTGRSLESILERRIVWNYTVLSGNLQNAIEKLLNDNAINPSDPDRKIEGLSFVASTDPKITGLTLEAQYFGEELYTIIRDICAEHDIGFKIVLTDDNKFEFSLYAGVDHSYAQSENPYVIFSPNFDNIVNSNYYSSNATLKNVTLVGGEGEGSSRKTVTVGEGTGLGRRELFTEGRIASISMDGGTLSESEINAQMKELGQQALTERSLKTVFEGEVETNKPFEYGTDFSIGDIVQLQNEYGIENPAYISELVFSVNQSGHSVYPTFKTISERGS